MRIVLLQLPIQSHDYVYSQENVPLAAGYLAAFLMSSGPAAEVLVCPPDVANVAGDEALVQWVAEREPDVVGFSCYLWNVERSLALSSRLSCVLDNTLFVFGGPEVSPDNDLLAAQETIGIGVRGEGELTFAEIVRAKAEGSRDFRKIPGLVLKGPKGLEITAARPLIRDLDTVPSPYLEGVTALSPRRTMVMETMRGCPMRCTYCHYHKSAPVVRAFSLERVQEEMAWGRDRGAREVTIVDPCFGRRPNLGELLEIVARHRAEGMSLSCELNAEDVTEDLAGLLARSGVRHVEIGLQSTNKTTLKNVRRTLSPKAFLEGVRLLRKAGIRVMVDVMVGLPGDGPEDVMRSVAFVLENDLADDLSLYPVSVLPGTVLKAHSQRFAIEYQQTPPYLVTRTPSMTSQDIRDLYAWAENVTGREFFPVEMPLVVSNRDALGKGYVSRLVLEGTSSGGMCRPSEIGQALCIDVRDAAWLVQRKLASTLKDLLAANPFTLVSWIVPEEMFDRSCTLESIRWIMDGRSHPADREYMATFTARRSCQVFIQGRTTRSEATYTLVPVDGDTPGPLWAALPAGAGCEEEERLARRIEAVLGERPAISFHDLEQESPEGLEDLLFTKTHGRSRDDSQ